MQEQKVRQSIISVLKPALNSLNVVEKIERFLEEAVK